MARVAIIFSGTGDVVESTVSAVRAGALAAGADTRVRRLPGHDTAPLDETLEALVWADGVVLGTVISDGVVAESARRLIGEAARLRTRLRLEGKVVAGLTVGGEGGPSSLAEVYEGLFSWGCLLVVNGGSEATAGMPTRDSAERLGRRVAEVATSLRAPRRSPLRRAG